MEEECRKLDNTDVNASIDLVGLNNQIVHMRNTVKRAKVQVAHKLIRTIKQLEKKKGTEEQVDKNKKKAERLYEEVNLIKELPIDKISKFSLANVTKFEDLCKDLNVSLEMKAMTRLACSQVLVKEVELFRKQHDDWESLAKFLVYKQTGRRYKKKLTKYVGSEALKDMVIRQQTDRMGGSVEVKGVKKERTRKAKLGAVQEMTVETKSDSGGEVGVSTKATVKKPEVGSRNLSSSKNDNGNSNSDSDDVSDNDPNSGSNESTEIPPHGFREKDDDKCLDIEADESTVGETPKGQNERLKKLKIFTAKDKSGDDSEDSDSQSEGESGEGEGVGEGEDKVEAEVDSEEGNENESVIEGDSEDESENSGESFSSDVPEAKAESDSEASSDEALFVKTLKTALHGATGEETRVPKKRANTLVPKKKENKTNAGKQKERTLVGDKGLKDESPEVRTLNVKKGAMVIQKLDLDGKSEDIGIDSGDSSSEDSDSGSDIPSFLVQSKKTEAPKGKESKDPFFISGDGESSEEEASEDEAADAESSGIEDEDAETTLHRGKRMIESVFIGTLSQRDKQRSRERAFDSGESYSRGRGGPRGSFERGRGSSRGRDGSSFQRGGWRESFERGRGSEGRSFRGHRDGDGGAFHSGRGRFQDNRNRGSSRGNCGRGSYERSDRDYPRKSDQWADEPRGYEGFKGQSRLHQASGWKEDANQKPLNQSTGSEKMHPSWEASRKRKEQASIQSFQGKKIRFDDSD